MVETKTMRTKRKIDPEDHFVVRGMMWNAEAQDFNLEVPVITEKAKFSRFLDADQYFDNMAYPKKGGQKGDIKLNLIHMRMGTPHMVKSKILFQ